MPGLFPDDAVIRRVSSEAILLLGGGRALLMQLAHPQVAAGACRGAPVGPLGAPPALAVRRRARNGVGARTRRRFAAASATPAVRPGLGPQPRGRAPAGRRGESHRVVTRPISDPPRAS